MDQNSLFSSLEVANPITVLKKVIEYNHRLDDNHKHDIVSIRIILGNGSIIEGQPAKINEDTCVMLTHNNTILFFFLNQIKGIEIINPYKAIHLFTDGMFFDIQKNDIPTALQVSRTLKELQKRIGNGFVGEISSTIDIKKLTDTEKFQLHQIINKLPNVIAKIAVDEDGRSAITNLKAIILNKSEANLRAYINNNSIILDLNLTKKLPEQFEEELKKQIETIL